MFQSQKRGGGRFSTVRHEHLLGLIGRSHSPAQAQVEERPSGVMRSMLEALGIADEIKSFLYWAIFRGQYIAQTYKHTDR